MARISRKRTIETSVPQGISHYRTALYARLSVEDSGKKDNDSIENQVYLIEQFVSQKLELKAVGTYIDNGETGVNFNRPGFKKLMEDIKIGKINCIVVKDLSRFGRNYIETGEYLDKILPFMGVRFISITDGYDSENADENNEGLIVALKNLINDAYAKDISQKSGSALRVKQQNGEFIGAYPPYGFKKSEEDTHKLILDERTAPIAQDIFARRAEGMGYSMIARRLNEAGISSPIKCLMEQGTIKKRESYTALLWQGQMIKAMTSNQLYLGHMVQGKTKKSLCDNMPTTKLPESDWIIVRDTHEPLISEEIWARIQALRDVRKSEFDERKGRYAHLGNSNNVFKGLLICTDCGSKMVRYKSVAYGKSVRYNYICPTRAQNLDLSCTNKNIRETELLDAVYRDLSSKIEQSSALENVLNRLNARKDFLSYKNELAVKIANVSKHITHIADLKSTLYTSYVDKLISETEYVDFKAKYDADIHRFKAVLEALQAQSLIQNETLTPQNKWLAAIKQFREEHIVSREMAVTLISRILVSNYNDFEIIWNFTDELKKLEHYVKEAGI